jgi:hypothetical protein
MVAVLALLTALSVPAHAITFTEHTCEDSKKIVEELIELELSGARWQGGVSKCLKQSRFHTIFAKHQEVGDEYLLQPEYVLSSGSEVKVVSKKPLPDLDAVEVEIGYLARKYDKKLDQKENFIKDKFVYRLNYGRTRLKTGCVRLIEEPKNFVMKEECLKK